MSPSWEFSVHGPRLSAAGYEPIPISTADDRSYADPGKQPACKGWQKGCPREDWPRYARCGVGILTRTTPALDIDVLHREIAQAIQVVAERVLGEALIALDGRPSG